MLVAVATLTLAFSFYRLSGQASDDSFIHRRVALNYLQTGKPYFNTGERVMVTSSPLWTLILAAADRVLPFCNPVPFLECLFSLVAASAAYLLVQSDAEGTAEDRWAHLAAPAAFLFVCAGIFGSAIDQMEAPLAIALVLVGALGLSRNQPWGLAVLMLACFARYEFVLLFLILAAWAAFRRRWTKSSVVACLGVAASGTVWLLWQFHTVIPNSAIAKSRLYSITYGYVVRSFIPSRTMVVAYIALGSLWLLYGRNREKWKGVAMPLLSFGVLLAAAYILRKTFVFSWYHPLVRVPVAIGVLLWTDLRSIRRLAAGLLLGALVLAPLARLDAWLMWAALTPGSAHAEVLAVNARVHEYRRIGAALEQVCPSSNLMTSEIGGLGWEFHGQILDGGGLASPDAIRYHPMRIPQERSNGGWGEIPSGYVRDRRPDLIVTYDIFAESALPAARTLGYIDYRYPLFVRDERTIYHSIWKAQGMHVLVAPDGRCSPSAVDQAVRSALER